LSIIWESIPQTKATKVTKEEGIDRLYSFIAKRCEVYLREEYKNIPFDTISSVIAKNPINPKRASDIIKFLDKKLSEPDSFVDLLRAWDRCAKIIDSASKKGIFPAKNVDENLLNSTNEGHLNLHFDKKYLEFSQSQNQLEVLPACFNELAESIHLFFENNMVLVEDKEIAQNRLALLKKVISPAEKFFDVTMLQLPN
jgi:glycyl-tRNA synthetase beta chain